jgi:hypothetical protein
MLIASLLYPIPKEGKVENVEITIGASDKFSTWEIEEAIECVKERFVDDYRGCELLKLWYDEGSSESHIERFMTFGRGRLTDTGSKNVIVLFSDFMAGRRACMTFNPPMLHKDWVWVLARDSASGSWRIINWGVV